MKKLIKEVPWWVVMGFLLVACGSSTVNLLRAKGIRGKYAPLVRENSVTFALDAPEAEIVTICGTFNGWNPESTPLTRGEDGVWRITLTLTRGKKYVYKFVMDGYWLADPENPDVEPDGSGGYNSVVVVKEGGKK
ncbi:MAG: isoamylase early set domain-containing protein [Brevinematales bacterium]|nr:isoamylase early set domain-containing protein [Brevinematales bacterium]